MSGTSVARAPQVPQVQPSRIDRMIAHVAPSFALRRYESKVRLEAASRFFGSGGFQGARTDRPALREWRPGNHSADGASIPDLAALRARGRDLERNTPIAAGALNTNCTSVVGTGLVPHPRIDREFLGLTEEQADAWTKQATRIWWAWAGTPACDIRRTLNFAAITELTLRSWLSGGDVFGIRRYKPVPGDVLATRIQLLEADRVCNPNFGPDSEKLVGGVAIDDDGAPIGYHVVNGHPGDFGFATSLKWDFIPVIGPKSGVRQVLHVFKPTRPEQTRGVPYFAPVIESLKQLDRYAEAELMAAVISAFFTVFIKSDAAGEENVGLADMGQTPAQPTNSVSTVRDVRLGTGAVVALDPKESIEIADPKRPNAQFDPFFRAFLNQIGVALEIPHELLIKQFTSSYSASRAAMLEAWRAFAGKRSHMIDQFCQPVYEWVLWEAVARGQLSAPGFFENPLVRSAWCETEWAGPAQGQIDPLQEINAAKGQVELGVKSRQQISIEMFGSDWERTHTQLAKERQMRARDGLDSQEVAARQVVDTANSGSAAQNDSKDKAEAA